MNEWEAKYRALLMGIDNPTYIENAEKLVRAAQNIAATTLQPFDIVFWALQSMVGKQQGEDTKNLLHIIVSG